MLRDLHIRIAASGFTAVLGSGIDELAANAASAVPSSSVVENAPHFPYHVTLLTKDEARLLHANSIANPFAATDISLADLVPLGVGTSAGASFIVVLFASANALRKKAGLPLKDFHITLSTPSAPSSSYSHDPSTLVSTISDQSPPPSPEALDALALHYFIRHDYRQAISVASELMSTDPSSCPAFVRLGDASLQLQHRHKVAMLAFGQAFDLASVDRSGDSIRAYSIRRIGESAAFCDFGAVFTPADLEDFEDLDVSVQSLLLRPWSEELREAVRTLSDELPTPTLCIPPRDRIHVAPGGVPNHMHRLQRFFRWIIPFQLAVSSEPRSLEDIVALTSPALGIAHILTLTENPLPAAFLIGSKVKTTHLPVVDFTAPSNEQLDIFMRLANDSASTPLLVHCAGGKGRAGTFIAAYLLAYGFSRPRNTWHYPAFGASEAISILRTIRPGSIESVSQEERVKKYSLAICRRGSPLPSPTVEPDDPTPKIEGKLKEKECDLLILVGLPGSGKSWFRNALIARDPTWTAVSGDEDGSEACLDRKTLLDLDQHAKAPAAIFFDVPAALCEQRAQSRSGHPSLIPGNRVSLAIKHFSKILTPPARHEGFSAIVTVTSFPSSLALVRSIAPPILIFKFPRTPHVVDLGARTEDDLHRPFSTLHQRPDQRAVITEKVDGANLGFSLDSDGRVQIQNRSHYVDSHYHAQFKKLEFWVESHLAGLTRYSSRAELEALLRDTDIHLTPVLYSGPLPEEPQLREMIQGTSKFSEQRMEGIYLKIEAEDRVVDRGKIVRADFIAGNEHWTRGALTFNEVVHP
ncbi:ATP dependent DNA ligase [Pseudohyphozyma bogoriensis]|nr:ATP dependent DNA ligase [Pseudohyphozyma bogoriensis]